MSTNRRRRKQSRNLLPVVASILVLLLAGAYIVWYFSNLKPEEAPRLSEAPVIYYFNNEVNGDVKGPKPGDGNEKNDYHFGNDRYKAYLTEMEFLDSAKIGGLTSREILALDYEDFLALRENDPTNFQRWHTSVIEVYEGDMIVNYDFFKRASESSKHKDFEDWAWNDLLERITPVFPTEKNPDPRGSDPALAAATLVDAYFNFKQEQFVPKDIRQLLSGEMPDALHLKFLEDPNLWEDLVGEYAKYVEKRGTLSKSNLEAYQSAMYMLPNGLEGDKPAIRVQETSNSSGHALVITTKDGVQMLRAECGWQSVRVSYWVKPKIDVDVKEPTPTTPEPTKPNPPKPNPPKPNPPKPNPPEVIPPKTGQEPTPEGSGYEGKPDNPGNPPEKEKPVLPNTNPPINPNTPPGKSDDGGTNGDGTGSATAPGASDDTTGGNRYIPPVQPGANPEPKPDSGGNKGGTQDKSQDPPANDGSAGDPNAIP